MNGRRIMSPAAQSNRVVVPHPAVPAHRWEGEACTDKDCTHESPWVCANMKGQGSW